MTAQLVLVKSRLRVWFCACVENWPQPVFGISVISDKIRSLKRDDGVEMEGTGSLSGQRTRTRKRGSHALRP